MRYNKIMVTKITSLLLASLLMLVLITGCSMDNNGDSIDGSKDTLSTPIRIAALKGPSGIGMVQLMEKPEEYQVTIYQSPDEVVGKILTGEVDVASLPPNLGAVLYQKTEGQIVALSPNTLGVLYILENGSAVDNISDLAGKTIAASGKGGATEYILNKLLLDAGINPATDLTMQWLANHSDVASTLMSKEGTIALLPEPFVSVVMSKSEKISLAIDLNSAWQDSYDMDLPMGVLIAQKTFVDEREKDLTIFMDQYFDSVNFVNSDNQAAAELISKYGLIDDKTIAEAAIPKCNIVISKDDDENKKILNNFYQILFDMEPKSVGGQIPDEEYYYKWTNK